MSPAVERPIRSALFVPAHREGWVEKALAAGPDAVIIDLEDSVPAAERGGARERVGTGIATAAAAGVTVTVRPNGWTSGEAEADLDACVVDGLEALLLPKVDGLEELQGFARTLEGLEQERGLPAVALIVSLESALGYLHAAELARGPRVAGLFAVNAKGGDAQRDLGFRPSPGGLETLYYRSHAILAARAARLRHILVGPWQEIRDLEALREAAAFNRSLGFTGEAVIHPSNVAVVHEAYAPTGEELEYHRGLIAAYEAAVAQGLGSTDYRGDHIDIAHYRTARQLLEQADAG
jgi:citrate lyase subunit beta/citryl-CoA lyase